MASSEAVIMQFNANSYQDPPPVPFFASGPITRQECHKPINLGSMTYIEVHYTLKELISLIYIDSDMGDMCGY